MSNWKFILQHINELELKKETICPCKIRDKFYLSYSTCTNYINYLHQAGYLYRTRRGVYVRIREIPTNLTLERIKKFVYFYDSKTRNEMIERYWRIKGIKYKLIK